MKTVYHNGVIVTGDRQQDMSTPPTCLVVENDLVAYVGNVDDAFIAETLEDSEIQKVNLQGRIILPGFIDGCAPPSLPP
jgi:predicted amidohydrolase YtcJ